MSESHSSEKMLAELPTDGAAVLKEHSPTSERNLEYGVDDDR